MSDRRTHRRLTLQMMPGARGLLDRPRSGALRKGIVLSFAPPERLAQNHLRSEERQSPTPLPCASLRDVSAHQSSLYPLQFEPVLKRYPWGGRMIGRVLGRSIPTGPVAESWEISAHPDGSTPVANGRFAGLGLDRLTSELGESLLGTRNRDSLRRRRFPLLIKILDAREWLSVQVHPSDTHALGRHGDLGKTEMWVVLAAEPGAEVLLGFRRGVDADSFAGAIHSGSATDMLQRVPARVGDVFFVPPGTAHAIGPGLLLVEIQQSSNITYRVFDWNRRPARPLHVDDAFEVLNFDAVDLAPARPEELSTQPRTERLATCSMFETLRLSLEAGEEIDGELGGASFEIWGSLAGSTILESGTGSATLDAVSWALLPATIGRFRLRAVQPSTVLRISTPGTG